MGAGNSKSNSGLAGRLLLESLVVIASILIAFAIDAWWEDREEREAEHALLARLQADVIALRPELVSVREEHRVRRDACLELLDMLAVGDELPITPEMDRRVALAFVGARTFQPGTGIVDAFIGGEGARLVENKRVADLLLSWPGLVEELQEEEQQLFKGATERWVPFLSSRTNIAPYMAAFAETLPDLAQIPDHQLAPSNRAPVTVDQEFLNHVMDRLVFQTLAVRDVEPLITAVDEMLALLEEEIGSE